METLSGCKFWCALLDEDAAHFEVDADGSEPEVITEKKEQEKEDGGEG